MEWSTGRPRVYISDGGQEKSPSSSLTHTSLSRPASQSQTLISYSTKNPTTPNNSAAPPPASPHLPHLLPKSLLTLRAQGALTTLWTQRERPEERRGGVVLDPLRPQRERPGERRGGVLTTLWPERESPGDGRGGRLDPLRAQGERGGRVVRGWVSSVVYSVWRWEGGARRLGGLGNVPSSMEAKSASRAWGNSGPSSPSSGFSFSTTSSSSSPSSSSSSSSSTSISIPSPAPIFSQPNSAHLHAFPFLFPPNPKIHSPSSHKT